MIIIPGQSGTYRHSRRRVTDLLAESGQTARRKLLTVTPSGEGRRLDIQFVSDGKYDDELTRRDSDGYTNWGLADDGSLNAVHFDEMGTLIKHLADDDLH